MPDSPAHLGAARGRRTRSHKAADDHTSEHNDSHSPIAPVYAPTGFAALGVPPELDAGLAAAGFSQPFAIQTEAIPVALTGVDVCGRARTGSGKTLAFGIPLLARLSGDAQPNKPRGLILVPTRELALQVAEVLEPVAKACGFGVLAVYGGSSRHKQIDVLNEGVEVVVATPLRLIDLLKNNELDLDQIEVLVLDEADRMADDGFTPQVEWILRKITGEHQTMLFSATLDGDVGHLVRRYLKDPVEVSIDAPTDTVGTMHHLFLAVHRMDKDKVVAAIASSFERVIVFCATKRTCDRATLALQEIGVRAMAIHGDLPQPAREKALKRFTTGEISILVATDVAARGIDIDDIGAVIHYEPAADGKAYLHRSGRTARAGKDGWAVTLAEYNQHVQCTVLQRALRLPFTKPYEVFSNNPKLRNLHEFDYLVQ